jgi:hypothetical protein
MSGRHLVDRPLISSSISLVEWQFSLPDCFTLAFSQFLAHPSLRLAKLCKVFLKRVSVLLAP